MFKEETMKHILSIALLSLTALAANATPPGNNGGGNGGCGVGQQTNGCGGTPSNNGGAGGHGGNAAARAEARATAIAAQAQRQAQRQSLTSSISNTVSTPVTVTVSAPASDAGAKTAATEQPVKDAVTSSKVDGYVATEVDRRPVNTAYAAPLTSSPETCMGSTSGGVQGASLGVSFGSTWESHGCEARMDARALDAMGMRTAAIARLCQGAGNRKAMEAAGETCPGTKAASRAEAPADRPVASLNLLP